MVNECICLVCVCVAPASSSPRFFVGHSIYKGKAALTVEPKAPEFTALDVSFGFVDTSLV